MIDLHGISEETFDDVIGYEVSSEATYEARYRRLTWPKLQSGATGGIGYDFGQANKAQVTADWGDKVDGKTLKALLSCCGVTGAPARALVARLHDVVDIPFDLALEVYADHDLPRYTALCRAHLPGYDGLSAHCKGALFSLVLNRGPSFDKPGPRYAEMRDIKAAIKSGQLAKVPVLFRSMKRIWKDDPEAKGLLYRREKEAQRWEQGLAEHHPEQHARLAQVAPVADPEVVARVQEQLRNLGYWSVGAADGSLTDKGKTEGAILAFRNHEGLPLKPVIDDALLTALAKAQPPDVADHRANATVNDLRAQGSVTIDFSDKVKAWGGRLFGGGAGLGGVSVLGLVTEQANKITSAKDAVGGLGLTTQQMLIMAAIVLVLAVLAAVGVGIWYIADVIAQKRLADHQSGKHP